MTEKGQNTDGPRRAERKPVMTEFVLGETSFVSTGISELKVTRDGKEEIIPIPIKSVGVVETQEVIDREMPKPPVKMETIRAESDTGQALGLSEDEVRRVYDYRDPEYTAQLREYSQKKLWAMIVPGLDIEFRDTAGKLVTDSEQIIAGLKAAGITGHQLDQLARDIKSLTSLSERQADFLFEAGSA